MSFKVLSFYFMTLAILAGCMGGGNQELQEATFGMTMTVSPDNQTLEDPATLAQDITVTVRSDDGSASKDSRVTFELLNPDSGAQLLVETCVTDKTGECSTQVIGGDDFGKVAQIKVQVAGTKLSKVIKVGIRTKIVPTQIQIVDPPAEIVAGKPFQVGLRLIDDSGRVAEDEEFNELINMGIEVTARAISSCPNDPACFNKTSSIDRRVTFSEGLAYVQGVTYNKAENLIIELYDHNGAIDRMEAATGRNFSIAASKTFNIVPDVPVRAQLEPMIDVTTDEAAQGLIKIYDQYDNHADNFGGACSFVVSTSGDDKDEAYIVDQGDSALRNKTGITSVVSGVGRFDIRDTNVETATVNVDGINFGCNGISQMGTSEDVDFTVGSVAMILLRQPQAPNDTAKTTEELSVNIEATDAGGNLTTAFGGLVGIDFDGGCSADINNDDEEVANARNIRLFQGKKVIRIFNRYLDRKLAEFCTVSLRSTAETVDVPDLTSTAQLKFVPGDPAQFSFLSALYNGEVGWGTLDSQRNRLTVELEQLDTWGNPIISGGNTKTVKVRSDGDSEINSAGTAKTVTFDSAGKGSIDFYNTKNETVNLTMISGSVGMRYTVGNSENVAVEVPSTLYTSQAYFKWGIPSQVVMTDPVDGTVDSPIPVSFEVQDYGGNVVQDFGTAVAKRDDLKIETDSGTVSALDPLEFVSGASTVRLSNTKEETVNISMALNGGVAWNNAQGLPVDFSGVQDVYFKWGSANRRFLMEDPNDGTVDDKITVKITVVDQFGNPVRDYGCSGVAQDAVISVNGTAKVTGDENFDHTSQANFNSITQAADLDIKSQVAGSCPNVVNDPAGNTHLDASFGHVHVFVRTISPYAADFQSISVGLDPLATGYDPNPSNGISIAFEPGVVTEYRMESNAGTVDDPMEVVVNALDQFENRVVAYAEDDAVTFSWTFDGSTAAKAYINANADGIPGNADDRPVDGDGNVNDFAIDFNIADRGVGKIYVSATYAETYQASLAAKPGYTTNAVADLLFKAGVVTQFDIQPLQSVASINTDEKAYFGIRAMDQYGNVNLEFVDTNLQVTANKSAQILKNPTENNPDNYLLDRPVNVDISAGVGEFYAYDPVKETATLTVTDSLSRPYSFIPLDVDFLHGDPVQAVISKINTDAIDIPGTMSQATKADSPATIKVEIQDRNGNIADTYDSIGEIQLEIQATSTVDNEFRAALPTINELPDDSNGQGLVDNSDPIAINITSGEGSAYLLARKVGNVDIFINPTSSNLDAEPAFDETPVTVNIEHGATKKYAIHPFSEVFDAGGTLSSLPNSTVTGTTDDPISMKVTAYDYYTNVASTDNLSEVQVNIDKQAFIVTDSWDAGSTGVGGSPYKSAKLRMSGGVGRFSIRDLKKENGIILSMSNPSDASAAIGHTRPVNITFGAPHYFAIIKPLTQASVDTSYSVDVEVRDQNHNVIHENFLGEVQFEVSGDAFLNTGVQNNSTGLPVSAKETTRLLSWTPGNDGTASMIVWNRKAETITLSLTAGTGRDNNTNASLGVTDLDKPAELKQLTFVPGYPDRFDIQQPTIYDSFAGIDYHSHADAPVEIEARAYDKYNNFCNNYSAGDAIQISLTSPSNQGYVTTFASPNDTSSDIMMDFGTAGGFAQGVGKLVIRDKVHENVDVTLVDVDGDGVTWTANTITVKNMWGAPFMFHIGTVEGTDPYANNSIKELRADVNIEVEAVAKDAYSNEVLNFTGKCDFEVVGTQVFYPVNQTMEFVASSRAKQVYEQRKVGSSIIRLKDNGEAPVMQDYVQHPANAQKTVTIVPGRPEQFGFIDPLSDGVAPADIQADEELLVTIEAQDKWGNRATSFGGVGADVQVRYASGTGEIENPTTNLFSTSPVAFTFTAGATTVTLKNEILDRVVQGAKNEPLKGETVTMGFLTQSPSASYTNDTGTDMDTSAELDITFLPDTAVRLEVVDFQSAGPYKVDDPVELRVEARDQYGNYTDDYTGNFTLFVDKNAWTYQGAAASNYQYLPTVNLDGQDTSQKEQVYTISANGWEYVNVANLTAETNVTINTKLAQNGIVNYDSVLIDWTYGDGVYYDIVFVGQENIATPQYTTDLVRDVEVHVLDKGRNIVQNYTSHQVRMKSDEVTAEFEGDDAGDDGLINVVGGIGPFQYRTRDDVISEISVDTSAPGRHNGMAAGTKQVQFNAGTVAQLVFANIPASISADDVIIGDTAVYTDTPDDYINYPVTCTTSPGQQTCLGGPAAGGANAGYPVHELRIEPQDKYGNINKIEGDNKTYQVQVKAHVQGAPAQVIWTDTISIVNGIAWKNWVGSNQAANELWTRRLFKSQDVTFALANPLPISQPDESSNTVVMDTSSTFNMNVTPGNATRLYIKPVSDSTIDFKIPITIEAQDAHNSDGNGNGNLVTNAPDMTVGLEFYSPTGFDPNGIDGTTGFSNGSVVSIDSVQAYNQAYVNGDVGQKDIRDAQDPTGDDAGSVSFVTIRKGVGVFGVEHLKAERVVVSLFDANGGTNEGDNGIYFTRLNVPSNPKEFEFTPGAPKKYRLGLVDSTGSVYTDTTTRALNDFRFEVRAFDRGQNFTPSNNGWAYVNVTNSGGGNIEVFATPDSGQDDGASIQEPDGSVNKNVKVVNGLGEMKFQAEKAGTVTLSLTSTSGLDMDPNNPEVTVNPGPGYEIVIIDPNDIALTNSGSVSDIGDTSKLNLSLIEIRGLDYYQNIASDLTGTVVLKDGNSTTMQAIDGVGTPTFVFPSFVNGNAAIQSLRLRNTIAENVKLEFESSNVQNAVNEMAIIPADASLSDNPANINQTIAFNPGPVAQLSLEINEDMTAKTYLDNLSSYEVIKEDHTVTDANSDVSVPMTVRTRDIYGNWNQAGSYTNEAQIVLSPRQGSAVALVNDLTANETLSISGGKVDFNVKLQDFGTNGNFAPDAREYGIERGMDFIDVSVTSATQGFVPFKQGGAPAEVKNPRRLYYHSGSAIALTLDVVPDTDTDSQEDIVVYARDQFGNVDARYGSAGCDRSVRLKAWKDAVHTDPATNTTVYETNGVNANEVICITNGVGRAKIQSTRAGRKYLTMEEASGGSLAGISPTTLNAHMDGKGTLDTERDFYVSPGDPQFFMFTDKKKTDFDFIDPNGGTPSNVTVATDTPGTRLTVDNAAYFYAYAVDNGGNICTQLDSNDRVTFTTNRPDAGIDTLDPLYGDFVGGEAVIIVSRTKSMGTDGLLNVKINLQGGDSGVIGTNELNINFDHGKTTGFAWTVPSSDVSIDSIAQVNVKAQDQFGNFNDNYDGDATFTAVPNSTLTGDINNDDQPYEPTIPGDSSDVDPTDVNYDPDNGGLVRSFVGGSLDLELMSLRAVGYTVTLSNAESTANSNGVPVGANTTLNFKNGSVVNFEIFDALASGYDPFDSSRATIDINISDHDQVSDLSTDYWAKIGVQALDRGGNRVAQYNQSNAFIIEAYDTSNNKITEKIDFVSYGGIAYQGGEEHEERVISFSSDPVTYIEMRAKVNITYELRLKGMPSGVTERFPSAGVTDKYVTFKNGSLAQVVFTGDTPVQIAADQSFTVEVEAQDQYGNKAIDYDGFIEVGIDDTTTSGVIKIPADLDFPSDAVFPPVASQADGAIEISSGEGSLVGFEYHKTNLASNRTITLYVKETDLDFDKSGAIGMTTSSHDIVVEAGAAQNIVFNGQPIDAIVDQNAQFKLRVEDIHGNLCYNIPETNLKVRLLGSKYGYAHKKLGGKLLGVDTDVDGDADPNTSDGNDIKITNGSETFVVWSTKSESVDINLFDSPLSLPAVKSFEFIADSPTELIFVAADLETPLSNGTIEAGQDYTVYAAARDQFQNIATGYTGTVELRADQNIVTKPATAGANFPLVNSFTFVNGASSMVVASETMTNPSALVLSFGSFTGSATITDKSAVHNLIVDHYDGVNFRVTAGTSSENIDNSVEFTVQAIDAFGNDVDDYVGKTVVITSDDSYAYASDTPSVTNDQASSLIYKNNSLNVTTDANGRGTFDVSTYKAGSVSMEVESADPFDAGKLMANGATGSTSFTFGAAKRFRFQSPPTNGTVDDPVVVTIEARDRGGLQVDTNYSAVDAVMASITPTNSTADVWKNAETPTGVPGSGAVTSNVDFSGGLGRVKVRSKKNQDVDITLLDVDSDPNTFPNYEGAGNDKVVPFKFGGWHHMSFVTPTAAQTTDDNFQFNVRAEDQFNNLNTDVDGTIKISAVNGTFQNGSPVAGGSEVIIGSAANITLSGGVGITPTIQVRDSGKLLLDGSGQNSQTVTFGFSDNGLTIPNPSHSASSTDVLITHGELYQYFLENAPVSATEVGTNVTLSVRITDENGNLVWDLSGNNPDVQIRARVGAAAPNQLVADGSNCSACNKNLSKGSGDFSDGYASMTYNSFKTQALTFSLSPRSDGHASSVVAGSASFNYTAAPCQRFTFKQNNSTYSWTPSNPDNFGEIPTETQKNGNVDTPISLEIAGVDKYGNLDVTCTESGDVTAAAVLAGDSGNIDWDTNYQPGAFTLSSGKKTISLRNKIGHGNLKIRIGFADKGAAWGNDETVLTRFDHGAAFSLDIDHTEPTLPKLSWNVDDQIPFTIRALDQEGNFNDNWTGSVQIYTNNNSEKGTGSNAGPFIAGTPAQNLVTGTVTTGSFTAGVYNFSLENLNRSTFRVRMQGATGGIDTGDFEDVTLEPGTAAKFTMDQTNDLNNCDSTGYWNTNASNDYYWPNSTSFRGFAGCNPYNAMPVTSPIQLTLRAYDRGDNEATNYSQEAPFDMILDGKVASSGRIVRDISSSAIFGDPSSLMEKPLFDSGIAVMYLESVNMGQYCYDDDNEDDNNTRLRCRYRWREGGSAGGEGGSLDLRFSGCADCPVPGGVDNDRFRFYFKAGGANNFDANNPTLGGFIDVDDTVDFSIKFINSFVSNKGVTYTMAALDFTGSINIVGPSEFGCEQRYGVTVNEQNKEEDGTYRVTNFKCEKIPRDVNGNPQLSYLPVDIDITSGDVANDFTYSGIQWRSGDPVKYKIAGSTSGQVSPMNDGTKYQKVTVEVLDQYGNVTRANNGTVNLTFSSGDNSRLGYDFDGTGAPTLATGGQVAITGYTNSDGDQDVYIKTDLAGSVQLGLNSPTVAPSVETNSHDMTFIPDIAVEYAVLHHDTGASTAVVNADTYTTVRVEARDQFGNIATTENNKTVSITGTGAGVQFSPSSVVTVNNGIGTTGMRKVVINQSNPASESMTVGMTAASNGSVNISSTANFTCEPGIPAQAVVVSSQSNPNVQQSQDTSGIKVDFDLYDQFDNPTKPSSGTVSADATLNQLNTSWNSSATTSTTLSWNSGHTVGQLKSRYIKTTLASNNHRVAMTNGVGVNVDHPTLGVRTVNIIHGNPDHWKMNINDLGTIYVNTDATYAIETYMMDAWDNVCNTAAAAPLGAKVTATVTGTPATSYVIDSSGTATGNNTETTSAGIANSSVRATAKTTLSIQASGGGLTSSSPKTLNVRWGSPDHMVWTTFAANKATGDAPDSYIVTMYDAFNNLISGYSSGSSDFSHLGITPGNVSVTSLGFTPDGAAIGTPEAPTIGPSQNVAWSGGTATYTLSGFESAGLLTIQADDSTSGSTAPNKVGSINISPAGATKIWIAPPVAKGIVSQSTDVTVFALDNFNNFADTGATIEICSVISGTIPTGRYNDDNNTATTRAYFDNPGTYCKTQSFGGGSQLTFPINVDQPNGYGFGWTEINILTIMRIFIFNQEIQLNMS
jgi:hypothetical protein